MNTKAIMVSFLVISLFIISFISFGVNFAQENDLTTTIRNDSRIDAIYTGVNDTIFDYNGKGVYQESNSSQTSFNQDDPTLTGTTSSILFSAVTTVGKSIMSIANSIFGVTLEPLLKALGLPREVRVVVGTILATILVFLVTLLAWKLYRQGN